MKPCQKIAYIALGSNLNNPIKQIHKAIHLIDELENTDVMHRAKLYKSQPMGPQDQPDFINTAISVKTMLAPEELMQALLDIEIIMGRVRTRHWGERVIDLDLIAMPNIVRDTDFLTLPHPHAHKREFVIIPLADIAPNLEITGQGLVKTLARAFTTHTLAEI